MKAGDTVELFSHTNPRSCYMGMYIIEEISVLGGVPMVKLENKTGWASINNCNKVHNPAEAWAKGMIGDFNNTINAFINREENK